MPGDRLRSDEPASLLRTLARDAGRRPVEITGRVTAHGDTGRVLAHFDEQVAAGATEIIISAGPGTPIRDGIAAIIAAHQLVASMTG
jgi:hypothetical protein